MSLFFFFFVKLSFLNSTFFVRTCVSLVPSVSPCLYFFFIFIRSHLFAFLWVSDFTSICNTWFSSCLRSSQSLFITPRRFMGLQRTSLKPTCTNGDRPFALFLVRNRRYVTNLIPNHVRARTTSYPPSRPPFVLVLSLPFATLSHCVPTMFNEFHAIRRARIDATPPV